MRIFNKMKGLSLFLAFQFMFFSSINLTYAESIKPPTKLKPSGLKVGLKPGSAIVLDRGKITKKGVNIEKYDFAFDGRNTFQDILDEIKDPDAKACAETLVARSVFGSLQNEVIDGLVIADTKSLKPSSLECGKVFVTLVPVGFEINALDEQGMVQTGDGWMANVNSLFINEAHAGLLQLGVVIAGVGILTWGVVGAAFAEDVGDVSSEIISDLAASAVSGYCSRSPPPDACSGDSGDSGDEELEEEEEEEVKPE